MLLAIGPLAIFFIVFQILFLRLPHREIVRIAFGTAVASAGLYLFLVGAAIGFLLAGVQSLVEQGVSMPSALGQDVAVGTDD